MGSEHFQDRPVPPDATHERGADDRSLERDELATEGAGAATSPWLGVGIGHVNDPHSPSVHRAVAMTVVTPFGPLIGWLAPDAARSIGENLIGHADACTELTVADADLLRLIVPGNNGG